LKTLSVSYDYSNEAVTGIAGNGFGLCAVACRLVGGRIAQNPCYKLAADYQPRNLILKTKQKK
ncbi:MAG: hypothetical protein EBR82_81980, partial [Caulobacteraceae bacterium]|nr:hypothetical protein [Caulobacteraceae bacterium]